MTKTATTDTWFDLPAYLARIGFVAPQSGPAPDSQSGSPSESLSPGLNLLRAVVAYHSAVIPFENIDVVLGRPIELGLDALQRKMIHGGRGGYCFEQNSLLRAALEAMGFQVTALLGRVVRGMPADAGTPRGHLVLRVELPEGPYLADVGFGNLTPTAPLALVAGLVQPTLHESYRLTPIGQELLLEAMVDGEWSNVYRLSLEPQMLIDLEMANWFTYTRPGSLFRENVVAARPSPGVRTTLFNGRLGIRKVAGGMERVRLDGPDEYRSAMTQHFGMRLTDAEVADVAEISDRFGERAPGHVFF